MNKPMTKDEWFASENSHVKIGDIIEDHNCRIKVDDISYSKPFGHSYPLCVYRGYRVRKDGQFYIRRDRDIIFQDNMVGHYPAEGEE